MHFLFLYYTKQEDSKLLCICSVLDQMMSKCGKDISDALA